MLHRQGGQGSQVSGVHLRGQGLQLLQAGGTDGPPGVRVAAGLTEAVHLLPALIAVSRQVGQVQEGQVLGNKKTVVCVTFLWKGFTFCLCDLPMVYIFFAQPSTGRGLRFACVTFLWEGFKYPF